MSKRLAVLFLVTALALLAPAGASANHGALMFDCGAEGMFAVGATETARPVSEGVFEAPPGPRLFLEENLNRVFVAHELWLGGQLVYTTPGSANAPIAATTCTATVGETEVVLVGLITPASHR